MNIPACSLPVWKTLYEASIDFREMGCWEWMSDSDVFGVQNPETGQVGYCCVLGQLGEVFGLAVYLGPEGLEQHRKIQSGQLHPGSPESAYSQNCLATWFGKKNDLEQADLKIIRRLGLNFRGANWPQFRSLQPGYLPWYLTETEAKYLALCLRETREVAICLHKDPGWLSGPGKNHYLVRVPVERAGAPRWESHWLKPAPITKTKVRWYRIDEVRLQRIKNTTKTRLGIWEVDAFYMGTPVKGENRPFFPYAMLCVDQNSGFIFGTVVVEPSEWEAHFPASILGCIEDHNLLPSALWVRKADLCELIEPLASRLGIEVRFTRKLAEVDRAKRAMLKYFKNR